MYMDIGFVKVHHIWGAVFSVSGLVGGGDGAVMCPPHNVHFPLRCSFHHCRLKSNTFCYIFHSIIQHSIQWRTEYSSAV